MTTTISSMAKRLQKLEKAADGRNQFFLVWKYGDGQMELKRDDGKLGQLSEMEYKELAAHCDKTGATLVVLNWQN